MKRTLASLKMVGLVGAFSVAGCSSNPVNAPTGGGGAGNAVSWESSPLHGYIAAEAKWQCGLLLTCCDASTQVGSSGLTQAGCEQGVLDQNTEDVWSEYSKSINAGRIVYNPTAVTECFAKYANDCTKLEGSSIYDDPVCLSIFVPQVADGDDCDFNDECAGEQSSCDLTPDSQLSGKCTPLAKEGELCEFHGCSDGLFCDYAIATPVCKTVLPDGAPCTQVSMCASEYCSVYTQTCVTLAAVGEACADSTQCASSNCDSTTNTCVKDVISMCGK